MSQSPLQDRFGRHHNYLRISLTDRCNLRCTYCMPQGPIAWAARESLLTAGELQRIAALFVRLGVDKIRLTGGEPTLRPDLAEITSGLAAMPGLRNLVMTTNGLTLERDAGMLREAGMAGLTVSLDTLRPDRFTAITRRDHFARVWRGIEAALAVFGALKLNVVMMRNVNDDELLDFVALTRDRPLHVRFIEYMPFHGTGWNEGGLLPYREMKSRIEERYEIVPVIGEASAVGRDFLVPGHAGSLGFVTSMTESFCAGCNRLRLTSDGHVKSCLFSGDEAGLRDALRAGADDAALEAILREALLRKPEAHPPMAELLLADNRRMVEIGG